MNKVIRSQNFQPKGYKYKIKTKVNSYNVSFELEIAQELNYKNIYTAPALSTKRGTSKQ